MTDRERDAQRIAEGQGIVGEKEAQRTGRRDGGRVGAQTDRNSETPSLSIDTPDYIGVKRERHQMIKRGARRPYLILYDTQSTLSQVCLPKHCSSIGSNDELC